MGPEATKMPSDLLAAVTAGFTLELWHAESGERVAQPLQLRGKPLDVEYSALHDTLLIAGEGNDNACEGLPGESLLLIEEAEKRLAEKRLQSGGQN